MRATIFFSYHHIITKGYKLSFHMINITLIVASFSISIFQISHPLLFVQQCVLTLLFPYLFFLLIFLLLFLFPGYGRSAQSQWCRGNDRRHYLPLCYGSEYRYSQQGWRKGQYANKQQHSVMFLKSYLNFTYLVP